MYKIGIDTGSTTMKLIALNEVGEIVYKAYRRHKANIHSTFQEEMGKLEDLIQKAKVQVCITGSAGIGLAERLGVNFIQEVVSSVELIKRQFSGVKTLFDLGGEDAKMVFFEKNRQPDIRMNGSCAGGTGAFIDQMATLLNIPVECMGAESEKHGKIYPIASRCGVFAKTDIQNLISRNIPVSDIAASTFYAVALQCITTLARGYDIKPPVLCVGGPLTFIPALRESFRDILQLKPNDLILPENSEYFPAWGAALHIDESFKVHDIETLIESLSTSVIRKTDILPALFENEESYNSWKHNRKVKKINFIRAGKGVNCFLGIDSGSTTTKIVAIDDQANILYDYYSNNEGNSLKKVVEGLRSFFQEAEDVNIVSSAVTGYGEDLVRSALNIDHGIVETMSHLIGARFVEPDVSFILDIGGQDIKSIFINEGVISNIELNEACSSGCGSFLQNFASSMQMDMDEFSQKACLASEPCDLGSRCTVFMNSKVKQALRESSGIDDIATGLAYSVVKNCLFKVLKISNLNDLGEHIVVQGGTFKNDAVYRALEMLSGKSVSSTDYPELMGAFGAALYARKMWNAGHEKSTFDKVSLLQGMNNVETSELQCKGCTNTCSILKFKFKNGNISYAGNKCEKIFHNSARADVKGVNVFEHKNEMLFNFDSVSSSKGRIGIPRVLNMFDNYPFWHALFSGCGYEVVLSPVSSYKLYQKGVGSVMSDNICFPAKLVHGHVLALIEQQVDRIFYPLVPKEKKEFDCSANSFNCPVVSGYPDVIRSSVDPEVSFGIVYDTPVIGFNDDKVLKQTCWRYFKSLGVSRREFSKAFRQAVKFMSATRCKMVDFQKEILGNAINEGKMVFVVSGRPYHADPLIHQKIGQILSDLGAIAITDDVFRDDEESDYGKLSIVSQWSYPNRVIQSALRVAKLPSNVQLIQMNSFGCGPDSFFMDEASAILKSSGKNLTIIRIDEIASPGSVRLRLRSLIESLKNVKDTGESRQSYRGYNISYTEKDREKIILVPWFCDFISPFLPAVGELAGYKFVNLPKPDRESSETGLKYGHNEVCYPSILVLGDIIKAVQSGNYNIDDIVIAITQTGGQCRATNYIAQIKTGLEHAGFSDIPIIALATGDSFQNNQEAFKMPWLKLANIIIYATLYGDALQQMYNSTTVREKQKGEARRWFDFYVERGIEAVRRDDHNLLLQFLGQAVADFNNVDIHDHEYSKIGLIGEIYMKYNNYAQSNISDWLRDKGMEVMSPPIIDFILQYFVNSKVNFEYGIEGSRLGQLLRPALWKYVNKRIKASENIIRRFRFYQPSESIFVKARYASDILNLSNQFGEGWTIAAEVAHYARHGVNKVVCVQPFGCIANHIVAKGIEKRLKKFYPDVSLLYLDIDAGIADVNLHNRLHFMIGSNMGL